ncbi:MAG: putative acetyltransferase [Acidimicrobiaceae bacterium]|nr:putative acetyltransferase [Acidimicrobiaceae bacterium]
MTSAAGAAWAPTVVEATAEDRQWIRLAMDERWSGPVVISRGRVHQPDRLGALVAWDRDERVGLITYRTDGHGTEVITLDALVPGRGIGTLLLERAAEIARQQGVRRLWLVTSNDNVEALSFYVHRGFRLVAVHLDALVEARRLKPSIPVVGDYNLPIRDELELELDLSTS